MINFVKKKKVPRDFIITDYNRNGNVIEDLSKVVIPIERQRRFLKELNEI